MGNIGVSLKNDAGTNMLNEFIKYVPEQIVPWNMIWG